MARPSFRRRKVAVVQEEEWVWILRSLALILARTSAAWSGSTRPARAMSDQIFRPSLSRCDSFGP